MHAVIACDPCHSPAVQFDVGHFNLNLKLDLFSWIKIEYETSQRRKSIVQFVRANQMPDEFLFLGSL